MKVSLVMVLSSPGPEIRNSNLFDVSVTARLYVPGFSVSAFLPARSRDTVPSALTVPVSLVVAADAPGTATASATGASTAMRRERRMEILLDSTRFTGETGERGGPRLRGAAARTGRAADGGTPVRRRTDDRTSGRRPAIAWVSVGWRWAPGDTLSRGSTTGAATGARQIGAHGAAAGRRAAGGAPAGGGPGEAAASRATRTAVQLAGTRVTGRIVRGARRPGISRPSAG